jgi:hypothetical protein
MKIVEIHKSLLASATKFYVDEDGPIVGPRSAHAVIWSIIFLYYMDPCLIAMLLGMTYSSSIAEFENKYGKALNYVFVFFSFVASGITHLYLFRNGQKTEGTKNFKVTFKGHIYLSISILLVLTCAITIWYSN